MKSLILILRICRPRRNGVPLEVLENALREKGYTTGILRSQSRWRRWAALVATRSIGQFSTLYGAIEDMVVGLEAVLADGTVTRIKTCHVARLVRHSSYHHRQRRCTVLYH
ncbi:hypothetical protein DMI70_11870 [Escherichia coli]|nr:hypothetical protein [Escherichia coli]